MQIADLVDQRRAEQRSNGDRRRGEEAAEYLYLPSSAEPTSAIVITGVPSLRVLCP